MGVQRWGVAAICAIGLMLAGAASAQRAVEVVPIEQVRQEARLLGEIDDNFLIAIGVNEFDDESVAPLRYCVNDARAIYDFFTRNGLVPQTHAFLLVSGSTDPKYIPTRANILDTIAFVTRNARPESTIILHFSGHGFVDRLNRPYLLPKDGRVSILSDTAVAMTRINELLSSSRAQRKIVFADACRNAPRTDHKGIMVSESEHFLNALAQARGQVTLASCAKGQFSYEMPNAEMGVFTHYVLEGLHGAASTDANGLITVSTLADYVGDRVYGWSMAQRKPTPQEPWSEGEESLRQSIPLAIRNGPLATDLAPPPAMAGYTAPAPTPTPAVVVATPAPVQVTPRPAGPSLIEQSMADIAAKEKELADAKKLYDQTLDADKKHISIIPPDKKIEFWEDYVARYGHMQWNTDYARERIDYWKSHARAEARQNGSAGSDSGPGSSSGRPSRPTGFVPGANPFASPDSADEDSRDEPRHSSSNNRPGANPRSYMEEADSVDIYMVWVPGGTFQMGCDVAESNEKPTHEVELDGFWMSETEITQRQWDRLMDTNPSHFRDSDAPVERVTWYNAMAFCTELSDASGDLYTLPTEAQWEYACRAGEIGHWTFGNEPVDLGDHGWYMDNNPGLNLKSSRRRSRTSFDDDDDFDSRFERVEVAGRTASVRRKQANAFGLYDMHGNVWEWCLDWYNAYYYKSSRRKNPMGPAQGAMKVLRGGSAWGNYLHCRSAYRYFMPPDQYHYSVGFRVVRIDTGGN